MAPFILKTWFVRTDHWAVLFDCDSVLISERKSMCPKAICRDWRVFKLCAFSFTDLKKTLAVLLDNILQRIGKLESKVDNLVINGTGTNSTNSTTAVPSLVALEKINVAGENSNLHALTWSQFVLWTGKRIKERSGSYWCKINPVNLVWPL